MGIEGEESRKNCEKAREDELRERIPVPHDNFLNLFKVRALRRLFLSVVSVTRVVRRNPEKVP